MPNAKVKAQGKKPNRGGFADGVKEHLFAGNPISRMEALLLFGVSNLTDVISELRKQGWQIQSRQITMAAALVRTNKFTKVEAPVNLPIREILMTDYWLEK